MAAIPCCFHDVRVNEVVRRKAPPGKGVDSSLSWHGSRFEFLLKFVRCDTRAVSPNEIIIFQGNWEAVYLRHGYHHTRLFEHFMQYFFVLQIWKSSQWRLNWPTLTTKSRNFETFRGRSSLQLRRIQQQERASTNWWHKIQMRTAMLDTSSNQVLFYTP